MFSLMFLMSTLICYYDMCVYFIAQYGIEPNTDVPDETVKKAVVAAARESWEIYFSRLFPASVSSFCWQTFRMNSVYA